MPMLRRPSGEATYIAVVGPDEDDATKGETKIARQVGSLLADQGVILVCGGLAGVMAAACEGASDRGGLTVGLLPGHDRAAGNRYLSIVLPTGMGQLRNGLVVGVCDAVIAIGGSWGTLSEVALAMRAGIPIVVIGGWKVEDPLHGRTRDFHREATSAEQAVMEALRLAAKRSGKRRGTKWWHLEARRLVVGQPANSQASPGPNADGESKALPLKEDLWRAYERAQQHYELDLQLFSTRMSLFLVVQSALIALVASAIRLGRLQAADQHAVASFGIALTVSWLLVASSSYMWVKTWRGHWKKLGKDLGDYIAVSSRFFDHSDRRETTSPESEPRHFFWKQLEWLSWYVRPTLVICCLPVLFIVGWVYLGWFFRAS